MFGFSNVFFDVYHNYDKVYLKILYNDSTILFHTKSLEARDFGEVETGIVYKFFGDGDDYCSISTGTEKSIYAESGGLITDITTPHFSHESLEAAFSKISQMLSLQGGGGKKMRY